MRTRLELSSPVELTPRVRQMAGLFDVPLEDKTTITWDHNLPIEDRPWSVGLITGPSGSGKSSLSVIDEFTSVVVDSDHHGLGT